MASNNLLLAKGVGVTSEANRRAESAEHCSAAYKGEYPKPAVSGEVVEIIKVG
jgi:hypothetical protein